MVYLDTNVFVYLLESRGSYSLRTADVLNNLRSQDESFITSVITITEFLAGTEAPGPEALQQVSNLRFLDMDEACAVQAALLQRETKLHISDAIHLATAVKYRSDLLFTNDKQLATVAKKYLPVKTL